MQKISVLLLLLLFIVVPASATYNKTFDATDIVVVNQSIVQDPTPESLPYTQWITSGCVGLILIVLALIRSKTQRMDYEVNIILSVLAWPFVWYWTWGGLTSVDYIVGAGMAASFNTTAMITQHIIYSPWLLGWIGLAGSVFAAFVTALLVSQYNLFRDNESEALSKQQQREQMNEKS